MATYLENNIEFKETDEIYFEMPIWNSMQSQIHYVGKSQKERHIGTWTFLDANKKDTIYGNAWRLRNLEQVMSAIKEMFRRYYDGSNCPRPLLKINGEEVFLYIKVLD
jgi:hypothetical protein